VVVKAHKGKPTMTLNQWQAVSGRFRELECGADV
jgi:hypothetical protein